ncbi:MAG: glucose dehydrogenase [Planctomycetota bacterium]|nr:MAG: glucose dehydrogenase [Planctomycetota bacterium]REK48500.1 MAG: glucose dehydrogenase [Planctomycetota bacterium]
MAPRHNWPIVRPSDGRCNQRLPRRRRNWPRPPPRSRPCGPNLSPIDRKSSGGRRRWQPPARLSLRPKRSSKRRRPRSCVGRRNWPSPGFRPRRNRPRMIFVRLLYLPRVGLIVATVAVLLLAAIRSVQAEEVALEPPDAPQIAEASPEAERAMAGFNYPEGWKVHLFAAEPLLANPVAFHITDQGHIYVCESYRQSAGVEDNRDHPYWVDDDLAARTVADRRAFILKHHGNDQRRFTRHGERLRLLVDEDADGRADRSTVFANGFNDVVSGTGAGALQRGRHVYYACVPDLWRLEDRDGDGKSDVRESLLHGFGVHFAYKGHDLHGLTVGPDGRLYFTMGDRGLHVETTEGALANIDSGAVLRCHWDGTGLELLHVGLRNPQELVFDDFGNLFVADNESDSWDESRLIPIVAGGDSGWRMHFQYLDDRGPFFRERLWHTYGVELPAYLTPAFAHVGTGPAGLASYPGTGLGDEYRGRFFLCEFRGGPKGSGVDTFRVQGDGAFYKMTDRRRTIDNVLATDVDFGPDGAVYVSDWVEGWRGEGKGRIYRFADVARAAQADVLQVRDMLRVGLAEQTESELQSLLGHVDRRIRQAAQFELVRRAPASALAQVAHEAESQRARLHAIWGLGQLAADRSRREAVANHLRPLLTDEDAEVRAQAARVAGEARLAELRSLVRERVADDSPRVRFQAAMSLSRLGSPDDGAAAITLLAENADRDPLLRHAGIMMLARLGDAVTYRAAMSHESVPVRRALAVAMRKRRDPHIAELLHDKDPRVVDEAARAIHDVPIPEAAAALAQLLDEDASLLEGLHEETLRRALNENYRGGEARHAERIARFATTSDMPQHLRVEALQMLAAWKAPSSRDRVLSSWRPLPQRSPGPASQALASVLDRVLAGPGPVRGAALRAAAALEVPAAIGVLTRLVRDTDQNADVRADSLEALGDYGDEGLAPLAREMAYDDEVRVRMIARRLLVRLDPAAAVTELAIGVEAEDQQERQAAWQLLGTLELTAAEELLAAGLRDLAAGKIPADTRLDVLLAARRFSSRKLSRLLADYEDARDPTDPLAAYRETLLGGDASAGRGIFFSHRQVACLRCHKVDGRGGVVGPELSRIGADKTREYLLESLVTPNRKIAKGYELVVVITGAGRIEAGVVAEEDDQRLRLVTVDGESLEFNQQDIEDRWSGPSAMPPDAARKLNLRELRDLIEFLASLRGSKDE